MARVNFRWEDWEAFCVERSVSDERVRSYWEAMHDTWGNRAIEDLMERLNRTFDGHGVEAIRAEGAHVDNYHFDIIATYVNTGDTYDTTVVFDSDDGAFHLTSYGDWLEGWEAEHRQEPEPDIECPECGEMHVSEEGSDTTVCQACREKNEPPPTWTPRRDQPLVAMLRSVEGAPIAVHLLNRDLVLGFSVPTTTQPTKDNREFFAELPGFAFNRSWPSLVDAFRHGQDDLYVTSIRTTPQQMFSIERDQFQRLAVAMDRFMEEGMERQPARALLETPPVLWTCHQVNEIQWIEGEHGHGQGDGVQAFVRRKEEVGSTIQSSDLVIWSAADDELEQLIEDGFIAWKNDDSVREYLQEIGICRAK